MAGFKQHVFVCLNERDPADPKGCCKHRGSEKIFAFLKGATAKLGLKGAIRINRAGCMDHCEFGPTVVIYPEGIWYRLQTVEDAREVLDSHIINGKVVARLLIDNIPKSEA